MNYASFIVPPMPAGRMRIALRTQNANDNVPEAYAAAPKIQRPARAAWYRGNAAETEALDQDASWPRLPSPAAAANHGRIRY